MVVLEQSDCFVFTGGQLITFNDEIMTRAPSPLDFDVVVPAADFLKVLGKLPDKEVDVRKVKGELIVKGKRRSSGITIQAKVRLPYKEVPSPKTWNRIQEGVTGMLKQAARTCGKDLSAPLTTVVHVDKNVIEACDNFRVFRATMQTGFPEKVLIPAFSMTALETIPLYKVATKSKNGKEGWAHFRTSDKTMISVRLIMDDYLDISSVLKMSKSDVVKLPSNLVEMTDRACTMSEGADHLVSIDIKDKMLKIVSIKESGWYKEQKRVTYSGPHIRFQINPKFLVEVLQRNNQVRVGSDKMKIQADGVVFVVCLEKAE